MANEYKVLKIDELTRPDDVRGIKLVYRYTVKSKGGTVFTIELDDPDPTAEKVGPILAAKAAEFDKIKKLGG